jgi:catechol 2,3-dioxygenase-like lactoylglutathione lyase family enzyme
MVNKIRHIGIVVTNLKGALHFWCDLLGFKIEKQMEEHGPHLDAVMGLTNVRVTTIKMRDPAGMLIELLYFQSHSDKPLWQGKAFSTGLTHIALTVYDLEDIYKRLSKDGFFFHAPPHKSPDGKVKMTYCKGYEGVLLELVEEI